MNYSVTLLSLFGTVLAYVLNQSGVVVSDADLQTTLQTIILIAGSIGIYWGRVRQGDVTLWGKK